MKATASSKRGMDFQNIIRFELRLYSLLSKLLVHFATVLTAIMGKMYKLPVRNHICLYKTLNHKRYLERQMHGLSRMSGSQ